MRVIQLNDLDPQILQDQMTEVIRLAKAGELPIQLRASSIQIQVNDVSEVTGICAGMTFMLNALTTTSLLLGPAHEV